MRKPTIYEALRQKLGRAPTNAELKADVQRILTEATQDQASRGRLKHQRRKNPKRKKHTAKWDRCVSDVKRRSGAASAPAVCTKALGKKSYRKRARNPRTYMIVATKRGAPALKYLGNLKFGQFGRALLFSSPEAAREMAILMHAHYRVLKPYKLTVQ